MHCHSRVQHLQRLHCHHSEAKRNKIIWIQQSQHIFHNLSSYTVFFLLSGYLASSFRPIDVCMDGTCARLCVYNMMVRWCMYFAFLLKNMSRILCNFVFASKDEPCNTQYVFLTHGTMLPVWSSDRAHAGRCLAKCGLSIYK